MFKLLIEDDEGGKKVVPIIRDEITIGRQEGNTIRLTERNVSRRHGRLFREDGKLFVEELSARYGLKKNGKRLGKREEFREGDVLVIGDYRLTLQVEKKAAPGIKAPPAAAPARGGFNDASTQITSLGELEGAPRERTAVIPAMPAKLVVISSNFAGQEFPLNRQEMVIGRGDDCHIIIDHRSISTKHAKIVREDNTTYKIVDLNSKNGVKVSGDDYRATHLKRGDVVELGHVKFRFVEPGENYVFTPQAAGFDDEYDAPPAKGGVKPLAIVGGLCAALLVGGIIFMLSQGTSDPSGASELGAVANVALDPPAKPGESDSAPGDDRLASALAKARADINDGQLQRAIGSLESVRDLFEPSAEQRTEISELLSQARNEQPFQRAYGQATELIQEGNHVEALRRIETIPSHSLFHKMLAKEGLSNQALDGAVAQAQKQLDGGDARAARSSVERVVAFDANFEPAIRLLARLDQQDRQASVMVATRPTDATRKTVTAPRESDTTATTVATKREPATKKAAIDPGAARELFTSAARKVASGDPRGAIADCQEGLRGGHLACHRILGVAYGQINDNDKACNHYRLYLRTGPSNAGGIESQMTKMGCS
ncbi:MAG: FHA domain-containing protein [Bradymonadaceae bacterium]|nr:FHA domain-containing protein [Lujinxingiaceae bacterium]